MTDYKHYVPLTVELLEVCGIEHSLRAMRLPKKSVGDSRWKDMHLQGIKPFFSIGQNDAKLASNLIRAGADHAKAMRGIIAYLKINMQVGFMIEFETYRHGVECLSTSSAMHGELKELTGPELADQKQADLPDKIYTRILTVSYQALRSMYKARKNHRQPDWRIFCKFIEGLPYFDVLIYPEFNGEGVNLF